MRTLNIVAIIGALVQIVGGIFVIYGISIRSANPDYISFFKYRNATTTFKFCSVYYPDSNKVSKGRVIATFSFLTSNYTI